jgi:internalin A
MAAGEGLIVKDGVVTAEPKEFGAALDLIRKKKLKGLTLRTDWNNKKANATRIDLQRLQEVPFLEHLGLSPSLSVQRFDNFDGIYVLSKLRALGVHEFKKLDLSRFPAVEELFLTDGPGLSGFESLAELRYARVTKLRVEDLSFLRKCRRLEELWIIQSPAKRLAGLDASPSLKTLELHHCSKLESVVALPRSLTTLKILKCGKLRDLSFVAKHSALEFLYVDVMETVGFVPTLKRLEKIGFENVTDGDLQPLLETPSLREAFFHPAKRKHYTHSKPELNAALASARG